MNKQNRSDVILSQQDRVLDDLRQQIDQLDRQMIEIMAERLAISRKIGQIKKKRMVPVTDRKREAQLRNFHRQVGAKLGVSAQLLAKVFGLLLRESRRVQESFPDII